MTNPLWQTAGIYLVLINLIGFLLMGMDKHRAKAGEWRIPEKTLFLPVILGGGLGGCLGMWFFHHKTRHWYFRFGFPLLTAAQWAGLIWLLIYLGR